MIDDGTGMNETDIREHLLGVFDSSKLGDQDAIGRFGIGRLANFKIADVVLYDTKKTDGSPVTIAITGKLNNGDSYQIYQFPGSRAVDGTSVVLLVKDAYADKLDEYDVKNVLTNECSWVSTPLYFKGDSVNKPFDISSEPKLSFEENGIKGVIALIKGYDHGVDILQRGIRVSYEYCGGIVLGLVDAERVSPVIGRAGIVKDAVDNSLTQ